MKKILWFSRHNLTNDQKEDLQNLFGDIEILQVNKTISHAIELKNEIDQYDVIAVVLPIGLQAELLSICKDKPVLICKSHRLEINGKFEFLHAGWEQLKKIELVKETLSFIPLEKAKEQFLLNK